MPWVGLEDWDFWLRVACHGGSFFHLPEIGFDYRVRTDSQIVKTIGFDGRVAREDLNLVEASPRLAKLIDYFFSKPEMAFYKWVRETDEEVQRLSGQPGEIVCPQIPEQSWNSKAVAIGRALRWRSLSIFSRMMMLPRAHSSCALLKTYGTVASIVRVGCGWKGKCFFTAHWVNAPYLGCTNSAGEFDLFRRFLINVILSEAKNL
jgi:hypothetical protein